MTDVAKLLQGAAQARQGGRWAEAERAYRRVLKLRPELAESWYNLGLVLRRLGRFDAALDAYAQALARGAREPEEIHLNRAVIYADDLRRPAEAERELNAALARNGVYAPALFNLANLAEDRGRRAEARALYERLLVIAPNAHEALARSAQLAEAGDDGVIARLRAALLQPQAGLPARASLSFALGHALDRAGAYGEAFNAFTAANVLSRRASGAVYGRAEFERLVDALIAAFPAPASAASEQTAGAPIFICGMFRSGSTLCEQVLAGHRRATAGGELDFIPRLAASLKPYPEAAGRLGEAEAVKLAGEYRAMLARTFPGSDLVTDKRPDNFLHVGLIKRLFPAAKIVHTTRHPLDNVLSLYFLHLDASMAYALDLADAAHHYRHYRRLMAHWQSLYGEDIVAFDYDAFVREPREQTARLLSLLGLDWEEECLAFHRRDNDVKTASVWQVREPLYARASGRWRNYEAQLAPVRPLLAEFL